MTPVLGWFFFALAMVLLLTVLPLCMYLLGRVTSPQFSRLLHEANQAIDGLVPDQPGGT